MQMTDFQQHTFDSLKSAGLNPKWVESVELSETYRPKKGEVGISLMTGKEFTVTRTEENLVYGIWEDSHESELLFIWRFQNRGGVLLNAAHDWPSKTQG